MSISENLARIYERMEAAARRARRDPQEIELMAVTKTVSADRIREVYEVGIRLFGENRVQEFDSKASAFLGLSGARCHMIGHLQTNKANRAVQLFNEIESVDSLRLARKLNAAAAEVGKTLPVLIEINIGGEEAKSGLNPASQEFDDLLCVASELTSLNFSGLMTVPPYQDDPECSRPFFRKMRELAELVRRRELPAISMQTLSMGMSHDFEVAIEEGATRVRLGTAIFGERKAVRSNA